jgi:positive regulator of sigma E activity
MVWAVAAVCLPMMVDDGVWEKRSWWKGRVGVECENDTWCGRCRGSAGCGTERAAMQAYAGAVVHLGIIEGPVT